MISQVFDPPGSTNVGVDLHGKLSVIEVFEICCLGGCDFFHSEKYNVTVS